MLILALVLALLLDSTLVRLKAFFRVAFFVPFAIPGIIAALLWAFFYQPVFSPIVKGFQALGLPAPDFLGPGTVLWSIANIATWTYAGYNMLIIFAALQAIPSEIYESPRYKQESNHHESTNRFRSHAHRPRTGHPQAGSSAPLPSLHAWGHDLPAHFHPVLSDPLFLVAGLGHQESVRFVRHLRAVVRPQLQSVQQSLASLYLQQWHLWALAAQYAALRRGGQRGGHLFGGHGRLCPGQICLPRAQPALLGDPGLDPGAGHHPGLAPLPDDEQGGLDQHHLGGALAQPGQPLRRLPGAHVRGVLGAR